jgi:hypothetical protein
MMTQAKIVHLSDLHFEHKLWLNELKFASDELIIYEHYLEDLVQRHDQKEMLAQLEQYQNQFIREKEIIDILNHDIQKHEHKLVEFARLHPKFYDRFEMEDHEGLRESMERFRKIFHDLKANFFKFMSSWN